MPERANGGFARAVSSTVWPTALDPFWPAPPPYQDTTSYRRD